MAGIPSPMLDEHHFHNLDKHLNEYFHSARGYRECYVASSVISCFPTVIMKCLTGNGNCIYSDSCFEGKVHPRGEGMVAGVLLCGT